MNMSIEKNSFKATDNFDSEFSSPNSREELALSSDDDDELLERRNEAVECDFEEEEEEDDEFGDADSGAGSDDFDLLELGETGAEFCQVGDSTCSVPFELYDLSGLEDVLSVDVWNEVLSEEERVELTKFLPDMDQFTFMRTLKELFEGENLHFGSPIKQLFEMLKGGLCEPRVALYKEGLNFFQKRLHYHQLREYHNSMVSNFCLARDAWANCREYSIYEKLSVLNIMKSQKSLMHDKMEEDLEGDSLEKEESHDVLWSKRAKDRRSASKLARNSLYGPGYNFELSAAKQSIGSDMKKYGKQNSRGILKSAWSKALPNEVLERFPSVYHCLDRPYGPALPNSRQNKVIGYDSGSFGLRDQMRHMHDEDYEDDDDRETREMDVQQDQNVFSSFAIDKSGFHKAGKKNELHRSNELAADGLVGFPLSSGTDLHAFSRNKIAKEMSEMEKCAPSHDYVRKAKYPENYNQFMGGEQMKPLKSRSMLPSHNSSQVDLSDPVEPIWLRNSQGQVFGMAPAFKSDEWNMRSKKWKKDRATPDFNYRSFRASPSQIDDRTLLSDLRARAKSSQGKIKSNYFQNGGSTKGGPKAKRMYTKADETESDSSEQYVDYDEEEEGCLLMRSDYPGVPMQGSRNFTLQSGLNSKKAPFMRGDMQENVFALEGMSHLPKRMGSHLDHGLTPGYLSKAKQKSRVRDRIPFDLGMKGFDESSPLSLRQLKDEVDRKRLQKLGKNGKLLGKPGQRLNKSSLKAYASGRKQKGEIDHEYYMEDDSFETRLLSDDNALAGLGKKRKNIDQCDRSEASLLGCKSGLKKRKAKDNVVDLDIGDANGNMLSNLQSEFDGSISLRKKGKRKLEAVRGTLDVDISEPPVAETKAVEIEPEPKPQKKPYTPITPTVNTGFSFSIIHLLSAVRMAMITPLPEESLEVEKPKEDQQSENEGGTNGVTSNENADVNKSENAEKKNVPSLTVQEIVNRVKSNPGDPCILETQEPLQDLVRGLLKIFSSKTAPLGAKGWKALVVYEKPTKSWSWIGPVSNTTDSETIEEVTSPEYWGLPHKMLVKLVDSFANWLKSGQETLQQIGSLPAPPLSLMQCNLDEKDRFRDLRAQKSLSTISPSSEEVREYFRKEEVLRYSIPDRAFLYTAADGKKSIVAPLRRCGGKPTSKARDHFMLKRDRPPHVTILCLVRDAASRLPGSIGTRADVCTLIRDSQYIVEDVSDEKVNQVVSGALDRLHYERDPCVQFDGERKLWVYLHREREEEDFEDDGTSSTKKWKRQKKDPSEQPEQGAVTVAFHAEPPGDNAGIDLGSDLNTEAPCTDDDKRTDLANNAADDKRNDVLNKDARQNAEGNTESLEPEEVNAESGLGPEQGNSEKTSLGHEQGNTESRIVSEQRGTDQGDPMEWDALSMNPTEENKLLCQQNSTNEDFDDETLGRERPVGLLGAG